MTAPVETVTLFLSAISPDHWPKMESVLSDDERARVLRFAAQKDRELYIAAHYLLRRTLSAHGATGPRDWRFATGAHGKPRIDDPTSDLQFNLTHTNGLVAVAVTRGTQVGIDAEFLGRRVNLDVADRNFSPAEIEWLKGLPEADARPAFLRIWTCKEAVLKATGKGLTGSLSSFTVTLDPTAISPARGQGPIQTTDRFQVFDCRPSADHVLAVALPLVGAPRPIRVIPFDGTMIRDQ